MGKKNKRLHKNSDQAPAAVTKKTGATSAGGIKSMTNWLLILVLVLPHLISTKTLDPALTIRYVFLAGFLLAFILFFYAWKKTAIDFSFTPLLKTVFILAAGYTAWSVVAMSSSINIPAGFYEVARQVLNVMLLFIIMQTIHKEEPQLLKLCKGLLLVAIIQGIVGILQYYEAGFNELPGANEKPYGLMSNRNLFGSAEAFLLPFILYVLYKASRAWKYISAAALTITIISLILSQTRSAWLAAVAILFVSLVLVIIFSPAQRKKWIIGSISGVIATGIIAFLLMSADPEGELSRSLKARTGNSTAVATDTSGATGNVSERIKIWRKTMELIKDHPLTGVGPANWKLNIASYGTAGLAWAGGTYIPDRVHNEYLQVTAETGLPGALLYFGSWLLIAIIGIITIKKTTDDDRRIVVILMLAGLAAFATDSMFSFPTERIEHSLYFMLMAGIILGSYTKQCAAAIEKPKALQKLLVTAFLLIATINLFMGAQKNSFEKHMYKVKAYEKGKRYADMITEGEKGRNMFVTLDPNGLPIETKTGAAYKELKKYDKAIMALTKALQLSPNSVMTLNNMGTVYTEMQQFDKAIGYYEKALKLAPAFDIVLKNLAINYLNVGNYAACIAALGKVNIEGDEFLNSLLTEAKRRMAEGK